MPEKVYVEGYSDLKLNGPSTLETEVLLAQTLAATDITLTTNQMVNGRIEVTTGHATHVFIVPTGYPGKIIVIQNNDAALAAGIKVAGGTAVNIPSKDTVIVQVNGAGTDLFIVGKGYSSVLLAQTLAAGNLTLTSAQFKDLTRIQFTTGHAANDLIVPVGFPGKIFVVQNNDASLVVLVKVAGGTAISIAATKTCLFQVIGSGLDVQALLNSIT